MDKHEYEYQKLLIQQYVKELSRKSTRIVSSTVESLNKSFELTQSTQFALPLKEIINKKIKRKDIIQVLEKLEELKIIYTASFGKKPDQTNDANKPTLRVGIGIKDKGFILDEDYTEISIRDRELFRHLVSLSTDYQKQPPFYFDGDIFRFQLSDGTYDSISFAPKKGETPNPYYLMRAYVDILKVKGTYQDGVYSVMATKDELIRLVKNKWSGYMHNSWLKDTKHNLNQKIPDKYHKIIRIENYDRSSQSYPFSIKTSKVSNI